MILACSSMLAPDQSQLLRLLHIKSRRAVQSLYGGLYHSTFHGTGLTFDEVREYQPGDDVRGIDWNVTARMGHAYLKRFEEERELTVVLAVDVSGSMRFGSTLSSKLAAAAQLATTLALCALVNHDRVGLVSFSHMIQKQIRPAKGLRAVMRILQEILTARAESQTANFEVVCRQISRTYRKRAIVFLMSDFQTALPYSLSVLARQHDLIAVRLTDPRECDWPDIGMIQLQDAETSQCQLVDTSSQQFRWEFSSRRRLHRDEIAQALRSAGADLMEVDTSQDLFRPLLQFFQRRERQRRTR